MSAIEGLPVRPHFWNSLQMPAASLLPLFAYFVVGALLRRTGVLRGDHAEILFRFVFFVTLPPLAFLAVADVDLTGESLLLPVAGFTIDLACLGLALIAARVFAWPERTAAGVAIAAGIANMVFTFPFVLAALGQEALAEAVLFDFGNAVFVATVANGIAARHADGATSRRAAILRLLRMPLFVALVAAVVVNAGNLEIPAALRSILAPLGAATVPVTIIALGMSFSLRRIAGGLAGQTVAMRMAGGLAVGLLLVTVLGFEGRTAVVVAVSAAAPIGFNAVTFAAIGKLDTEQVAAAVSLSVLVGMLTTSLLLWLGNLLLAA